MSMLARAAWWLVPAVLGAAAAYQLALDLSPGIGGEPGADPPGQWVVVWVAAVAMLSGAAAAGVAALGPPLPRALPLYAPAAAAVLVTRFYEYDPYYAPSLRRFSEGGNIGAAWIFGLAAGAVIVGVVTAIVPRAGTRATIFALLLIAFTSFVVGVGH